MRSAVDELFDDATTLPVQDGGDIPMSTASVPPQEFSTLTRDADAPIAESLLDDTFTLGSVEEANTPPALRRIYVKLSGKQVVAGDTTTWVEYSWYEVIQDAETRQFITKDNGFTSTVDSDDFANPAYNLYEIPLPVAEQVGLEIPTLPAEYPVVELIETYLANNTKAWVLSRSIVDEVSTFVAKIESSSPQNGSGNTATLWNYAFVEQEISSGGTYSDKTGGTTGTAVNTVEIGNVTRPTSGTATVSQGVTVGVRSIGNATVTTYLNPIRDDMIVDITGWNRVGGGTTYHFSVGNAWDDEVSCN